MLFVRRLSFMTSSNKNCIHDESPGGGMVDTQHLKCCEATRAGSSPALGTLKGHILHTTCS